MLPSWAIWARSLVAARLPMFVRCGLDMDIVQWFTAVLYYVVFIMSMHSFLYIYIWCLCTCCEYLGIAPSLQALGRRQRTSRRRFSDLGRNQRYSAMEDFLKTEKPRSPFSVRVLESMNAAAFWSLFIHTMPSHSGEGDGYASGFRLVRLCTLQWVQHPEQTLARHLPVAWKLSVGF